MKRFFSPLLPVLVVEDNPDHQLLIGYSFRASIPQVEPIFCTKAHEALNYLEESSRGQRRFPRFILLDIYLPEPEIGFQLLKELRARYPRLPIIVISAHQDPAEVGRAYELGACSFIVKPLNLTDWEMHFHSLRTYWLETITLPPSY